MSELISGTVANGLATITLSRPEAGNAMNWALVDSLFKTIERLSTTPGIRAFLIVAEGKNFCVGGDIRSFVGDPQPAAALGRLAKRLHEAQLLLAAHPAPVIVAAQGASAGAGLSLAASADILLAADDAQFSMAYAGIGLTGDGGATWFLPRLVGLRVAQEMAYLGRRLSAEEGLRLGLVTRIVPSATLLEEARSLAAVLAQGPTKAFGEIKALFAGGDQRDLEQHLDMEADSMVAARSTQDAEEGIAAFLERRKPAFQGR